MDTEILEDLGLSPSEIKTYTTLLELGTSSAGSILEKSRLQNSVVHRALNKLIEQGLVSYILKGKHKVYSATEPEYFLTYIDEKKKQFQKLLPALKAQQERSRQQTSTTMYKGKRGIKEVYAELLAKGQGELLTFGGSKETTDFIGLSWWQHIHLARVEQGVANKHVASTETYPYIDFFLKLPKTKIRFLPQETFSQYQETAIRGDYVTISIFADEGYSILIHNKDVAEGYRKNFAMLWKLAQEKPVQKKRKKVAIRQNI